MPPTNPGDLLEVRQRHGLSAARVIGDRHHHERNRNRGGAFEESGQSRGVDIPLERVQAFAVVGFWNREVDGLGPDPDHVRPGGVEMHVVGHDLPRMRKLGEQEVLRCPPLVGRDDVGKPRELPHRRFEVDEVTAPGICLVAQHHPGPLPVAHRRRARVGQ